MTGVPGDPGALLPHGPAARFVREILTVEPGLIVMRGAVPADSPFVRDGVAPAVIALELAAQSAGVLEACVGDDEPDTPPNLGYIVGLRELSMNCVEVPAGRDLIARVTLDGVARPLTIYRVSVSLDGADILTGKISIFTAAPGPIDPA